MTANDPLRTFGAHGIFETMQTAKLVRYGTIGLLVLLTVVWFGTLPIAFLAIGFSGGELLSPSGFFRDLLEGDLFWTTRLWAWFALGWPLLLVVALWRLARRV